MKTLRENEATQDDVDEFVDALVSLLEIQPTVDSVGVDSSDEDTVVVMFIDGIELQMKVSIV